MEEERRAPPSTGDNKFAEPSPSPQPDDRAGDPQTIPPSTEQSEKSADEPPPPRPTQDDPYSARQFPFLSFALWGWFGEIPENCQPRTSLSRLLLALWWFGIFVLVNVYLGGLIGAVIEHQRLLAAQPETKWQISTFTELMQSAERGRVGCGAGWSVCGLRFAEFPDARFTPIPFDNEWDLNENVASKLLSGELDAYVVGRRNGMDLIKKSCELGWMPVGQNALAVDGRSSGFASDDFIVCHSICW